MGAWEDEEKGKAWSGWLVGLLSVINVGLQRASVLLCWF